MGLGAYREQVWAHDDGGWYHLLQASLSTRTLKACLTFAVGGSSPEALGGRYGVQTDVWSYGVMTYEVHFPSPRGTTLTCCVLCRQLFMNATLAGRAQQKIFFAAESQGGVEPPARQLGELFPSASVTQRTALELASKKIGQCTHQDSAARPTFAEIARAWLGLEQALSLMNAF